MAKSTTNGLTHGYYGKVGDMVYRRFGNKSILQKLPDFSGVRWSKAQKGNRKRFRDATVQAHKAMADPELRAFYQKKAKKGQTAWNVAISDFMLRPVINEIDLHNYHGRKGDTVTVRAHDKYGVAAVLVFIYNGLGVEVESGMATMMFNGRLEYVYEATADNTRLSGGRVEVRVADNAGNIVKEFRVT